MNAAERAALIDQYEAGYDAVTAALEGIGDAELEAREGPGEWCPREICHHLADSEMTSAIRLRLLIAHDAPLITGYDQEAFVDRLYSDRPIEPSLAAFAAARASTVPILRRLSGGAVAARPARTVRAAPTRPRTGCASTPPTPTTTPTRSAARGRRWLGRDPTKVPSCLQRNTHPQKRRSAVSAAPRPPHTRSQVR